MFCFLRVGASASTAAPPPAYTGRNGTRWPPNSAEYRGVSDSAFSIAQPATPNNADPPRSSMKVDVIARSAYRKSRPQALDPRRQALRLAVAAARDEDLRPRRPARELGLAQGERVRP